MFINPLIGEKYGLPLSGVLLCLTIFILCWFFIPRIGKGTVKTYLIIGFLWIILTVLFETVFGLLEGITFANLIRAYDITTGNIWLLVVLFTGFSPFFTAKTRKLI